jgi:hypothetical protein
MADDGSQHRKPDFRTAVKDVKTLATVLVINLESVFGSLWHTRPKACTQTVSKLPMQHVTSILAPSVLRIT